MHELTHAHISTFLKFYCLSRIINILNIQRGDHVATDKVYLARALDKSGLPPQTHTSLLVDIITNWKHLDSIQT